MNKLNEDQNSDYMHIRDRKLDKTSCDNYGVKY